jgi:hypothetical protein
MASRKAVPENLADKFFHGESMFFQDPPQAPPSQPQPAPETPVVVPTIQTPPPVQPPKQPSKQPSVVATMTPRKNDTVVPRHHDTVIPPIIEQVRRAVKQFGKEAATHRFTQEEKQELADIIYTYSRRGYRTSENEIARIAINWLVLDYKENGEESVLVKALKALND